MKISKQRFLQILKEEISPVSELSDTKISTTGMGTTKRIQQSRERIAATDPELTTQEAGILNQIEEFLSDLASTPGVDLMQKRSVLERILKMLQDQVGGNVKGEQNE